MDINLAKETARYQIKLDNEVIFYRSKNNQWLYCSLNYYREHFEEIGGKIYTSKEMLNI